MKLSIITVNLNNKGGLVRTVESVLSQSFKDFEYIIIDGGSRDGSKQIIQEASSRFPAMIWLSEPDSGVFNAMNKGVHLAKGDYFLFLNSGDFLVDNDVLARVFAKEYTDDILLGIARVTKQGKTVWKAYPKKEYTLNNLYHGSLAHQAAFIKKDLFNRFGDYREDLRFMSDWEFFLRTLILNRCSLSPLDIVICDYNIEGISSDKSNSAAIAQERQSVYLDLGLDRIVPDYAERDRWKDDHKALLWAWRNPVLHRLISFLYRFANKRNSVS